MDDVTDCPFTYLSLKDIDKQAKETGYLFNFTGDPKEQKQKSIELLIFLYEEASTAYDEYLTSSAADSSVKQSEYYKWLHRYLACRHHHQYNYLLV